MSGVVEDLVAQFAGHAEPGDEAIDARDGSFREPEPGERLVGQIGVGHPGEYLPRARALHFQTGRARALIDHAGIEGCDVVLDPGWRLVDVERGHGEQELVRSKAEDDQIVEDPAVLLAQTAVEAPSRLREDVPGADVLHRRMGLAPLHEDLAHGMPVEQDRPGPAGTDFLAQRREMLRHLPPREIEEGGRTVRDVLAEVRRPLEPPRGHLQPSSGVRRGTFESRCQRRK